VQLSLASAKIRIFSELQNISDYFFKIEAKSVLILPVSLIITVLILPHPSKTVDIEGCG
jgi:hypothetical protein